MASTLNERHSPRVTSFESADGSAAFESAAIVNRRPIHLPSLAYQDEEDQETVTQRNATEEFELPAELAAMIANAKLSRPPAGSENTSEEGVRYYATYDEGRPCKSKSISEFEQWDESFGTLEECCEVSFSWDYDACLGL